MTFPCSWRSKYLAGSCLPLGPFGEAELREDEQITNALMAPLAVVAGAA